MADPKDLRELARKAGIGLPRYKQSPWAGKRFGPPAPDWKDQALDELAGPHSQLIPMLAEIAYNKESGKEVQSKAGLLGKLIEGLESGAGWKPGDPTGDDWKFKSLYQHLRNKEGELNRKMFDDKARLALHERAMKQFKGTSGPIADVTRTRSQLTDYSNVPAPPPALKPQHYATERRQPYTSEQGKVLGFWNEYQRELMKRMHEQGKQYSPLLHPAEYIDPSQRPRAPR